MKIIDNAIEIPVTGVEVTSGLLGLMIQFAEKI